MDVAYDHIQEEIFSSTNNHNNTETDNPNNGSDDSHPNTYTSTDGGGVNLNEEIQETFRAFSASPWGTRLGGLWDNVRKQGETYYAGARQEYAAASEEAVKGFSDLRNSIVGRTRNLSLSTTTTAFTTQEQEQEHDDGRDQGKGRQEQQRHEASTTTQAGGEEKGEAAEEGESFISRFRAEAARRLKEIEKAEEAADEAILRFGMNIRDKLREAVSIIPPSTEGAAEGGSGTGRGGAHSSSTSKVLFESRDAEGKRVIHATRFEAQLHVIHSNMDSFTKDPASDQWEEFAKNFDVEAKTNEIATDLEMYPDLRAAMEKLVPETVEYADFWRRYYYLRLVVETEEKKRRELLKGATTAGIREEDNIAWDDDSGSDSDSESNSPSTPHGKDNTPIRKATASGTGAEKRKESPDTLKPADHPRRSHDGGDSESSYDLVSGTTSRAPDSPKEKPTAAVGGVGGAPSGAAGSKGDESDEDWE